MENVMVANDDLARAIKAGDASRVRELLGARPALAGARDASGVSMVLLALYHQRRDVAEAVLEAGPPLDVFDAAAAGRLDRLRALLAADPGAANAWAADGFFPLGLACFFRQPEAARLLLEAGADPRAAARKPLRVTALHATAAARDAATARELLDRGADVDARQQMGYTALHAAAQHGDVELVELLLSRGADPALRSEDGKDAAAHARENGHHELAGRLASAPPR
ncbi:MAG TPA: ankyrin repeat domain-containing protein [Vicinamibacteria bacterium]|nr:ankyrin repeat domain-containing protein [Vicinamibacteria bacterium]